MSVVGDIFATYRNPHRVMVRRLAHTNEAKALMTLMVACLLIFVAQWPLLARLAETQPSIPLDQRIGGALMGWVFMAPLLFYGLAGLIWLAIRMTGRPAPGLAVRATFFWSLLAATPLWLAYGIAQGLLAGSVASTVIGLFLLVTLLFFVISAISLVLTLRAEP